MTKTHTVETIEEFNDEGKLIRKTTTETTEESDAKERWYPAYDRPNEYKPWWGTCPQDYHAEPAVTRYAGTGDVPLRTTTIYSSQTEK